MPLAASAFFVSIALLVNTLLAMSIPDGGVSAYNLGNKIVLLITGLVGAGVSTVMLPYFSTTIAKNNINTTRKELSIFLLFLTFISTPISIGLFIWAEPIVNMIFEGGEVKGSGLGMVVRVMQYAVVQIPFFACNILLLKYATATKHVLAILVVAILFFMGHMGVAGIALGASIAMVLATIFLVLLLMRYRYISLTDGTVLFLNWLLFITFLMSIHFKNESGTVVTIATYFILLTGYSWVRYKDKITSKQVYS
jgi:putative peptidoglycan lipid II flippase